MKKITLFCLCFFISVISFAQQIVNIVLVGDKGITDNIEEAHSFVLVKKYPDCFQRLDYKIHAPLQKLRSYSDSTMTVLNGLYIEYARTGYQARSGYYSNNLKDKDWYTYNEKGKQVLLEKYEDGVLISSLNVDTVYRKDSTKNISNAKESATIYKNDWSEFLKNNLNADVANQSVAGGQVIVQFTVTKEGKCVDVSLDKSVEYILDEEAIHVIEKVKSWLPLVKNGEKVNAYRRQPITFLKQ